MKKLFYFMFLVSLNLLSYLIVDASDIQNEKNPVGWLSQVQIDTLVDWSSGYVTVQQSKNMWDCTKIQSSPELNYTNSKCFNILRTSKYAYFSCYSKYDWNLCKSGGILKEQYKINTGAKDVLDLLVKKFDEIANWKLYDEKTFSSPEAFLDKYIGIFENIWKDEDFKDSIPVQSLNNYLIDWLYQIKKDIEDINKQNQEKAKKL